MKMLKRRQLNTAEQQKPKKRRRTGILVAAAAAFTLLAVPYFLTPSTHKEEAMRQAIPQKTSQEETSHSISPAPKKKTLSNLKDVRGRALAALLVHLRTKGIVLELQREFPYKSLDCSFILLEENKEENEERENQNLVTRLFDGTKRILDKAVRGVDGFLAFSQGFEKYCEARGGQFRDGMNFCVTDLTEHLADLWNKGDAVALAAAINYLDSLNLEWPEKRETKYGPLWFNTLCDVYEDMFIAAFEGKNPVPEPSCVARNAYAYQNLVLAGDALSEVIVKNPSVAEEALSKLSAYRRSQILHECICILRDSEEDSEEPGAFDSFFVSLAPSVKKEFLAFLREMPLTYLNISVDGLKKVIQNSSEKELRDAVKDW